jgi:hypothetical protein
MSIQALRLPRRIALFVFAASLLAGTAFYLWPQDIGDFPPGFDALQAAPGSHKLLFENSLVRVLEVDLPKPGEKGGLAENACTGIKRDACAGILKKKNRHREK